MKKSHEVWLQHHPLRDADWLRRMLAEGFHVHHIDGDGENNAIDNLVLIEGADHMRLHGRRKLGRPTQVGIRLTKKRLARIAKQYEDRKREIAG